MDKKQSVKAGRQFPNLYNKLEEKLRNRTSEPAKDNKSYEQAAEDKSLVKCP